jgi:outer membrane cobalamin receptor
LILNTQNHFLVRTVVQFRLLATIVWLSLLAVPAFGQTTALLRGAVVDAQGAALPGATVRLVKSLTGLERTATTGPEGGFQIANVPLDTYELRVEFPGFATHVQQIDLRTSVPVELPVALQVAAQTTSVTVTAEPVVGLVDTVSAGTRHVVSMARIEQLPVAVGSRGLESILATFPGFAQNANGAIHPRGAHNQMTYVIDGMPISDQLTGAFANALDASVVQTAELMTGNIPAEFGSKVSGVAVLTTRSGLGIGRRLAGDVLIQGAGFNTWHSAVQVGGGSDRVGYFGSVTAMRTDRFLDQVSLDNLHNAGQFGRGFFRADVALSERDMLRLHTMGGRSTFEVANLRSQHAAGQDQQQALSDVSAWASHLRTLDAQSTLESTLGYRTTSADLTPSAGDTPVTAWQDRRLSTVTASTRYSRVVGQHMLRAGLDGQWFPITERFAMGITNPAFNDPSSPSFNEALLPYDLTRGGALFGFTDERTGRLFSGFVQSTLRWQALTVSAGARYDDYTLLVHGRYVQPRVGLSYRIPRIDTVLRASYNRNYQTPPNENLLLSSSEAASRLAPESVRQALGGAHQPIRSERQNVYEVGVQRALGRLATVDLSAYRKDSRDQQDNNNFFDTGIIFPTTLRAIRVTGAEARLTFAQRRGLSGTLSATTGRAISTPPFTGGLFLGQDAVDLLSAGPFAIDHDQRLSVHGTMQWTIAPGLWTGTSIRYDSGLVSNPSDPAEVAADPDFADLLPYVNLTGEIPRVRPRTIVDLAGGYDVSKAGRRIWSVQVQATNLTDRTALYNFQSVFVGTRLIQPRTFAVRVRRYF